MKSIGRVTCAIALLAGTSWGSAAPAANDLRESIPPQSPQALAIFPDQVVVTRDGILSWASMLDIEYVRIALVDAGALPVIEYGQIAGAVELDLTADVPPPGTLFGYLVKEDAPLTSWDAEAGTPLSRDSVIPPTSCSDSPPPPGTIEAAVDSILTTTELDPLSDMLDLWKVRDHVQQSVLCMFDGQASVPHTPLGCLDAGSAYNPSVAYCGFGNSACNRLGVVPTTDALNQQCFMHDECYREYCIETPLCAFTWQSATWAPCDAPLATFCADATGAPSASPLDRFTCSAVAALLLRNAGLPTCVTPSCDGPGEQCEPSTGECFVAPEAHWPLDDGEAYDVTGNGYDGTVYGAVPAPDRNGTPASALDFDGIDDSVVLVDGHTRRTAETYSVWVKPHYIPQYQGDKTQFLLSHGWDQVAGTFHLMIDRDDDLGKFRVHLRSHSNTNDELVSPAVAQTTRWYHLVYVRDDQDHFLYIDGSLVDSTSFSQPIATARLHLGRHDLGDPWEYWAEARMDDVRFYGWALTPQQVEQLHSAGAPW